MSEVRSPEQEVKPAITDGTGPVKQCRGCLQMVAVVVDSLGVERYIKHVNANGWGWDCISGGQPT